MELKYLFYLEVLIAGSSSIMAMAAPSFFVEQMDVVGLSPTALVFIQWYGVLLFAFTLIMALTLFRKSYEAVKVVFPAYALGDILHIGVTVLLANQLGLWNFAAFFGIGFTLILFIGRILVLQKNVRLGF